jgi:hypothetical protein
MPYADPEKRKQAKRESYRRIYNASRKFRREEAERKAEWLQTKGKPKNAAASARARAKKKAKMQAKAKPAANRGAPATETGKPKASRRPGRSSRSGRTRAGTE